MARPVFANLLRGFGDWHLRRIVLPLALTALIATPALADTAVHWTRAFAAPLFLLGMISPVLFVALGTVAVVQLALRAREDRHAPWPLWPFLALVVCTMPLLYLMTESGVSLLAFWPGVLTVTLTWHWSERLRGNRGLRRPSILGKSLALAALAIVLWQATGALTKAALFAQVTLAPPGAGEPPFAREFDGSKNARPLTAGYRLALHRFPDATACLQPGADPSTAEGLARLDWSLITSQAEAEVCLFRLLASLPDGMAGFTTFAEAQGFSVSAELFNPISPYVERDGTLRVTGYWSIRHNGPKYPISGLIRVFYAVPYSMSVDATYTPDGNRLLHVRVGFNTL